MSLQLNAVFNMPGMASIFKDKQVLDCSELVLQISLFYDEITSKAAKTHNSTADSSPSEVCFLTFSSQMIKKGA